MSGDAIGSEIAHFSTKALPCNAPDAPQILDPPGNPDIQSIPNYPYQYRWSAVAGAVQYEFTVYWVPSIFNPPDRRVVYRNYYSGTVSDSVSLACGGETTIYLWSVRAKSSCGAWSGLDWSMYFTCYRYP